MSTYELVDHRVIRECVETACRAPSVHNSQPWKWRYRDHAISLYPDAARLLRTDPHGRQLIMSCGAALHHLDTALRFEGLESVIDRFPAGGPDAPIATVTPGGAHECDARDFALHRAMGMRSTDRRPFRRASIDGLLDMVSQECSTGGVTLVHLDGDALTAVVSAAQISTAAHRYDSVYQNEIRWWAGHDRPYDGIPISLLGSRENSQAVVGRDFPTGTLTPSRDAEDQSDWLLVCTATDSPESWLRSGEALSLVLLSATAAMMSTCTVTHVIQDPASRDVLRKAIMPAPGRTTLHPQVLIRVGAPEFPALPARTTRRLVDDVLVMGSDDA